MLLRMKVGRFLIMKNARDRMDIIIRKGLKMNRSIRRLKKKGKNRNKRTIRRNLRIRMLKMNGKKSLGLERKQRRKILMLMERTE